MEKHLNKKLDIRMLLPCADDKRPVVPLNYTQWLFNSKGYDDLLIRFLLHDDRIEYEEFDGFTYIYHKTQYGRKDSFIMYDIVNDIIYLWEGGGERVTTVSHLLNYCKEYDIKVLLETPEKCTYGKVQDIIDKNRL